MEIKNFKYYILFFIPLLCLSQEYNSRVINFNFNRQVYEKIAKDSIKKVYNEQKVYYLSQKSAPNYKDAISINYKWSDLEFFSIPQFRIKRDAYQEYSCKSSIEDYIQFEEYNKYQEVVVLNKNEIIVTRDVPLKMFEFERIYNPSEYFKVDKKMYENYYIKSFLKSSYAYPIYNLISKNLGNFYFQIYGLEGVLFEINGSTGYLYSNFIDEKNELKRLPANEYLRRHEGELRIRELARGYYIDIDNLGTLDKKPCGNSEITETKIILRAKQQ